MKHQVLSALPNFPEEVVDTWLMTFARDRGWPPTLQDGSFNNDWKYLFGGFSSIDQLRSLKWEKRLMEISFSELENSCKSSIRQILEHSLTGYENWLSLKIHNLKERFDRILKYIEENGEYPKAPILKKNSDNYSILDGNHRMAAYFYCIGCLREFPSTHERISFTRKVQFYWVAT